MEVININVNELTPYENNPRNNNEAIQYVANSIKEFGFKVPLVIDSDNIVICGHTRLLAAKQLGIEEVPCIVADDLTDEQINIFQFINTCSEVPSRNFAYFIVCQSKCFNLFVC